MNNDNFLIDSSDLESARAVCNCIKDDKKRSRAVACTLAAEIAKKYFTDIDLDDVTKLHNIPAVLENIELSDIYIKNNYIDVRLCIENEPLLIPQYNFLNNIRPLAYMFIRINKELSSATVLGFISPESINPENTNNDYIQVTEDELVSYYDVESSLAYLDNTELNEESEINIFNYLDNKVENLPEFYNMLLISPEARLKLKNAANVKNILSQTNISITNKEENTENFNETSENSQDELVLIEQDDDFLLEEDDNNDEILELASDDEIIESFEETEVDINEVEPINDTPEELDELEPISEDITEDVVSISNDNDNLELELEQDNDADLIDIETEEIANEIIVNENNFEVQEDENSQVTLEPETENINTDTVEKEQEIDSAISIEDFEFDSEDSFSTSVTPSLNTYEENDEDFITEESLDNEIVENLPQDSNSNTEHDADIEVLFQEEDKPLKQNMSARKQTNGSPILLLGIIVIIALLGYFGYTKFYLNNQENSYQENSATPNVITPQNKETPAKKDAMPIETVENTNQTNESEEAVAETIPAIENNLDASILVSNLTINWEVPSSYLSSNSAKRYFTKLGKIIQLNLKTELLLMNNQPITNKISVELEFNKESKKFNVKNILLSSGDKNIDKTISNTIEKALNINLNTNMSIFENITGNPVLVIHL